MAKEFRVVYDNNKDGKLYTIEFGSHGWIRDLKVAQKLLEREQKRADSYSWIDNLYLQERETDEPDTRQPMREYEGKPVYNYDHLIWDVLDIGDFVEQEVADGILDALPPACMRSDYWRKGHLPDACEGIAERRCVEILRILFQGSEHGTRSEGGGVNELRDLSEDLGGAGRPYDVPIQMLQCMASDMGHGRICTSL